MIKILRQLRTLNKNIIEYVPNGAENYRWTLLIDHNSDKLNYESSVQLFNKRLNVALKRLFTESTNINTKYWDKSLTKLSEAGFYIPEEDLKNISPDTLKLHISFYTLLLRHFDYKNFFESVKTTVDFLDYQENIIPRLIWIYIFYYSRFLYKVKNEPGIHYEKYKQWHTKLLDKENFYKRLPSEQLTILLLTYCEAKVAEIKEPRISFFSNKDLEMTSFFDNHSEELDLFLDEAKASESSFDFERLNYVIEEFKDFFREDKDLFLVQETLDNQSKLNLSSALPLSLRLKYGPLSVRNLKSVVVDKLFNSQDRPAGEFSEDDKSLPAYKSPKLKVYPSNVQYWFDLVPGEREKIIDHLRLDKNATAPIGAVKIAKLRCQTSWINLLNLITGPVLVWQLYKNGFIPQFNFLDDSEARKLRDSDKKKKRKRKAELELLDQHRIAISSIYFKEELEKYLLENPIEFTLVELQNLWEFELRRIRERISQRISFYESRMKEFGIYEAKIGEAQKRTLMKEIFTIEEEVKPYITYVKKAFQTALPIRNKVQFSEYRHNNDGAEFDPDTLFDQEKWIRAEVMKVMESKIEKGEAIQINTFCLDFSGSMKHDRMRNLFKILYLLVLGLEDRKSIDAFHFFSNKFIPVADFSSEYTNRKVLFRIMQQITSTSLGWVHYSGSGGTNISDGIEMSHKKMKAYVEEFNKTNPKANIVTSIFVITDGEPSLGIIRNEDLKEFIETKRLDGDVEIKGIFIKSKADDKKLKPKLVDTEENNPDEAKEPKGSDMSQIFGEDHFIETSDFRDGVDKFVKIMTETYKAQRKKYKWKQKKQKLGLTK